MKPKDKVLLSFGALTGFMLLVAGGSALTPKRPSHQVIAHVVDMDVVGVRFPRTVVVAKAPKSLIARATFSRSDEMLCQVGDEVDGQQTGITLVIDPYTCRRPHRVHTMLR